MSNAKMMSRNTTFSGEYTPSAPASVFAIPGNRLSTIKRTENSIQKMVSRPSTCDLRSFRAI